MKLKITTSTNEKAFYGHGKLLITSEYFVLDGAQALALPTKFGQSLRVKKLQTADSILYWRALNSQLKIWLDLVFDTTTFTCINSEQEEAKRLTVFLQETRKLNPDFLADANSYAIETTLEFPNEWGLGSSSTFIHCLAEWAQVDGYKLLKNTIAGSGYDVACAAHHSPILYQLKNGEPETLTLNWKPLFSDTIYFAYTGKKQLTSDGIKYYKEKLQHKDSVVNELSHLTQLIINCTELNAFRNLIEEHENIIASQLKMMKVRDTLFADYWGSVKSLGAWGGDFVLLTNERTQNELEIYLKEKNIEILFSFNDLIL